MSWLGGLLKCSNWCQVRSTMKFIYVLCVFRNMKILFASKENARVRFMHVLMIKYQETRPREVFWYVPTIAYTKIVQPFFHYVIIFFMDWSRFFKYRLLSVLAWYKISCLFLLLFFSPDWGRGLRIWIPNIFSPPKFTNMLKFGECLWWIAIRPLHSPPSCSIHPFIHPSIHPINGF